MPPLTGGAIHDRPKGNGIPIMVNAWVSNEPIIFGIVILRPGPIHVTFNLKFMMGA